MISFRIGMVQVEIFKRNKVMTKEDKDALVAEIESKKKYAQTLSDNAINSSMQQFYDGMKQGYVDLLSFIDTLEVKGVDLELITGWFDHIAQIADDRMTLTNQRMTDAHALDEIKCLAKNSSEFITKHYKAQKGE